MCYKYLWDSLIAEKFPAENFFSYFDLDPNYLLSDDIKQYISSLGFDAKVPLNFLCVFLVVLRQSAALQKSRKCMLELFFLAVCLDIHATIYSIFYNPCEL